MRKVINVLIAVAVISFITYIDAKFVKPHHKLMKEKKEQRQKEIIKDAIIESKQLGV